MVTQHLTSTRTDHTRTDHTRAADAAQHLYEECALHTAHQSHVDAWIAAAGDRLHEAVVELLAARVEAALLADSADQRPPHRSSPPSSPRSAWSARAATPAATSATSPN